MNELPYSLDRTVLIRAAPETVFRFFTDSARWATWWGAGSTIDAQPGGKVYIRHPGGIESAGQVLDVRAPRQIVFTYGFVGGKPIPEGSSRVTIRLEPHPDGTRLYLTHELADATVCDEHVQGWRFQLSLFSNAVANEVYANATAAVDAWFKTWEVQDDTLRGAEFGRIAAECIRFRDRFSALEGLEDLNAHAGASQKFMPGIGLARTGPIRHCQGSVLADWIAAGGDGQVRMSGTSLFLFQPDGRLREVTGFSNLPLNTSGD